MASAHDDVVAIGAGHNGLVAAAYLAAAGTDVLELERSPSPHRSRDATLRDRSDGDT